MWRTIVAVIRGGNFAGAVWQRPQLERNRFSPSSLMVSSWALAAVAEAVDSFAASLLALRAFASRPRKMADASSSAAIPNLIFIVHLPAATSAGQSGKSSLPSIDWHSYPGQVD